MALTFQYFVTIAFLMTYVVGTLGGWGGRAQSVGAGARNSQANRYPGFLGVQQYANSNSNAPKLEDSPGKLKARGLGVTAWGIVAIIVGAIMAIVGLYYVSVFYPILCKKEKNYDPIDHEKVELSKV